MNNEVNIQTSQLNDDLEYIKNEIIAKQKNGKYCKVSRILKSVSVTGMTKDQYINYWLSNYKNKPENERNLILEAVKNKIENDLTDIDEVIKIETNSKDINAEKESIIKEITKETP